MPFHKVHNEKLYNEFFFQLLLGNFDLRPGPVIHPQYCHHGQNSCQIQGA